MRLARVRLRNFRCYQEEIAIDINDITALIGQNDSGKSALLDALSIFFEEAKLDKDDASIHGDRRDVRIICEFDDLPDEVIIDAQNRTSLADEHLLNAAGRLEVHRVFDGSRAVPKETVVYAGSSHPAADGVDDLLSLRIADLRQRAEERGVDLTGVDERVSSQIRLAIWNATEDIGIRPREIPLDKEDSKKIWDNLKKHLPTFALFKSDRASTDQDAEAQDPMKAAVKEALKAKEDELQAIADHVEHEVKTIADATIEKLKEMAPGLASQLNPRFTKPTWANVFKISLTGDEEIPLNKRGSGVRRLILLNFFRAKAESSAAEKGAGGVIYAIEEPETSQHPDSQRNLMRAFAELAAQPGCQVIVSTHTPQLARLLPIESLRYIEVGDDHSRTIHIGDEETYRTVADALGVLPDHGVQLFIGIEGPNDINFLKAISGVLIGTGEDAPDLESLDDDGKIIFFPLGGSNLALWTSRLANLNVPEFYLFDRDAKPPEPPAHQQEVDEINARDGCEAFSTGKREMESYLHPDAVKAGHAELEVVVAFGDFDDVPMIVARAVHEMKNPDTPWDEVPEKKQAQKTSRAKQWLNAGAAAAMTADLLTERDPSGDVRGWLQTMKTMMVGETATATIET